MRKSILFLLNISFILILLNSCKSIPKSFSCYPSSLEDLSGVWISSNGEYEYPFCVDNKKYIRFSYIQSDDTELWEEYAYDHGMEVEELWKKRYSHVPYIYASNGYYEKNPISDSNGTEFGRKVFMADERIYSRQEILIPEKILISNFHFFLMKKNKQSFMEEGRFYLASDVLEDLPSDGVIYKKTEVHKK